MTEAPIQHSSFATDGLAIVEKYEAFMHYVYPILQSSPRKHGVLRDKAISVLLEPIGELYSAARSRQVSKLYAIDAQFATLRSLLRFLVRPEIKILSPRQHEISLARIAEPGRMLGAWQKKLITHSGVRARPMGQTGKL